MGQGVTTLDSDSTDLGKTGLLDLSARELADHIASRRHAMAGAVIALSASQACALGEACVRISVGSEAEGPCGDGIAELLSGAKRGLLGLAGSDGDAIAAYAALRDAGRPLEGQELLCELPAETGRLAVAAAEALEAFRSRVVEQVHDDLEMAIVLLKGDATAAMLLLDSNLRIWPEAALHLRFEPLRAELEAAIRRLEPVSRLRG